MRNICAAALMASVLAGIGPASAEVKDTGANGFTVVETATIAAPPEKVYAAFITPAKWWNGKHTFSQNAANLSFEARAGGCFCETLPGGGSVQHLVVFAAMPGQGLTLRGAIGPLQAMAMEGAMAVALKPAGDGATAFTLTYSLAGYMPGGMGEWPAITDAVVGEQVVRLKRFVETGSPGE
ncbi:MAG TPA: hypothetical protein VFB16_13825 [Bauldia sp.]|nr:hypothetical protein [Bauldia sp.]